MNSLQLIKVALLFRIICAEGGGDMLVTNVLNAFDYKIPRKDVKYDQSPTVNTHSQCFGALCQHFTVHCTVADMQTSE